MWGSTVCHYSIRDKVRTMHRPVIALTMGDPAGIGPELIVKVLSRESIHEICRPVVIAAPNVLADVGQRIGIHLQIHPIEKVSDAWFSPPTIDVMCPEGVRIDAIVWGKVDAAMGKAATLCLEKAFKLALDGLVEGVVAAPLNKQAFHLAGYAYLDDLTYLAELTHSPESYVLGAIGAVWTVAVTLHVPFRDIAGLIKKERVSRYTVNLHNVLRRVGYATPRIAVAALNVHGGEGGLFGQEEITEIGPAIQHAKEQGIDAVGPCPADTVFVRARDGEFDGVVCMYHDQANIARKLLATMNGATIYMGLPVVCGTTAHGTAFDKAGKGISLPTSLEAALRYTVLLAASSGD
jgi:4-phospho-D-threonate 3-dehydrogenase / 4-phospho-D-erythronate 3-dehydrogenase